MNAYAEHQFRAKMEAALGTIRKVLDNTRNPETPANVPHQYDDKYILAEFVTQVAMASLLQCLENVGLSADGTTRLVDWVKTRSVSLRLSAQESCRFLREETRKIESPEHVTEVRGVFGKTTRSEKVLLTVTEYFWRFDFSYEIVAYQGNAPENAVALLTRSGSVEIKTSAKQTPRPKTVVRPPIDVDVSWLLSRLDEHARPRFAIDRASADCHTPRRNPEVDRALEALAALHVWCGRVVAYFRNDLFSAYADHGRDLSAIDESGLFVPVVPLFENGQRHEGEGLIPPSYATAFLEEQRRSLAEKWRALSTAFPNDGTIVTAVEAGLLVTLLHVRQVVEHHAHAVDHIEQMLRNQLVAAIGKVITPADFTAYMDFHHRKLVKEAYRPRPFSYAVRRPDHDPEGVVSVEVDRGKSVPEPVSTTVAWTHSSRPIKFALDASTRVSFTGDRYLHAWVTHQFSGQGTLASHLVARARQFSSFILLVGKIASADVFEPRFGVLVQNKDLLKIPLLLEEIPTPKQFRDAIESLSPEQQRFARAFRGMQLESTLFGVCVIQVKPQLEKLLKLPPDSLTKEIKLTQQLLELFTEYQIPSDLLSYDGVDDAPVADKLGRVKDYTARMFEMIDLSKRREIEEEQAREALRLAEMNRTPVVAPGFGPPGAPGPYGAPVPSPMMASAPMMAPPAPMMAPPAPMRASPARTKAAPAPPAFSPPPAPAAPQARMSAAVPSPPAQAQRLPPETRPAEAALHPTPEERGRTAPAEQGSLRAGDARDYTKVPGELDRRFEELDDDAALHSALIHPGNKWTRTARKGLLSDPEESVLEADEQETEKHKTFDLLDALTKSGALAIEDAS
ncbi:MAG TPA: hypothetical protein VM580_19665, partial [Labilithrix sp.]|nr:hypothetical protein [Labilithrix sp.]